VDKLSTDYYDAISAELYTAVLADVLDDLGHRGQVMRHDIRPLYEGATVVGRAATMLAADVYEIPAEPYKLEMRLLDSIAPGEVAVCAAPASRTAAIWGELLSTHVRARGGRGAVIDGLTRDTWGIVSMRFPVFCAGASPADSKGRCDVVAIRVPVSIGGVLVRDGDLIVGDSDGCLAVPQPVEDEVIERARAKVSAEDSIRHVLEQGASLEQVFGEHGIL
jgi:4-hydroxy-4-methyl-2-oxoglutarate aldolase